MHSTVISELKLSRAPRHEFKWDPVIQEVRKRLEKEDARRRVREERGFRQMTLPESRLQQKFRADPVAEANLVSDPYGAPSNYAGRWPGQPGLSDPAVSDLTQQMQALALPLQARVPNMSAPQMDLEMFARSQLGHSGTQGGIPYNRVGYGSMPAGYNPPRFGPCFYCGQEGHSQKRCHQLTSDITNGLIHLNACSNKLHAGPPGQGGEEIRIIRNIPTRSIALQMCQDLLHQRNQSQNSTGVAQAGNERQRDETAQRPPVRVMQRPDMAERSGPSVNHLQVRAEEIR